MESILRRIEGELVPRINQYNAAQHNPIPPLELKMANNSENIPLGLMEHQTSKWAISDMYRMANPHPATTVQPYLDDVQNLSKFLQTRYWMGCQSLKYCM